MPDPFDLPGRRWLRPLYPLYPLDPLDPLDPFEPWRRLVWGWLGFGHGGLVAAGVAVDGEGGEAALQLADDGVLAADLVAKALVDEALQFEVLLLRLDDANRVSDGLLADRDVAGLSLDEGFEAADVALALGDDARAGGPVVSGCAAATAGLTSRHRVFLSSVVVCGR